MNYNILNQKDFEELKIKEPKRFKHETEGGEYLDLRGEKLKSIEGFDTERINRLASIVRGFAFAAIEAAKSGHPGGSSSKTEQFLTLLFSGVMAFDPMNPKNPGRDRVVWSAGHCSPLLYAGLCLIYESYRKSGCSLESIDNAKAVLCSPANVCECLVDFRTCKGPAGHIESYYPLADVSTGSSGHGLSAAAGLASLHRSCGLETKVFVLMGDAETEEGMSYEARNMISAIGLDNIIVSLDYNHYGIDGNINEVVSTDYVNHWRSLGWNVIEIDGHNLLEAAYAYHKAVQGFNNQKATVIIAHTIKGKHYGKTENTADSHGAPAKHDEYVEIMKKLGFEIPGIENEAQKDIEAALSKLTDDDVKYIIDRLDIGAKNIKPEKELILQIHTALKDRPLVNPKELKRPDILPPELVFKEGEPTATRKATEAWFKWLMQNSAFFYLGAGDLMKSILTGAGEQVYGIINKENPLGRGLRFGIAEQNMAMFSTALTQDILPGGYQAVSAFSSYGVFTSIMANSVRMALINNYVNPKNKGFFIVLAAHDGPETGEDGPTHHGLFWMALYNAYPGIKVYKPNDANEAVEMLFYALEKGEPVAFSVMRPNTPVFERGEGKAPPAKEAVNGAYVFRNFKDNGKKKIVLAVCGGQVLANVLEILPNLEKNGLDVKIIAVTSPELFEELREKDKAKADSILSDEERQYVITLHNGWPGFLYPFALPKDYNKKTFGISRFLKAGPAKEVYELAELTPKDIEKKIINSLSVLS